MSRRPLNSNQLHVIALIRAAFAGVTLGDGVGLLQAQGIDAYADCNTISLYRSKDEKDDWSAIPVSELNKYSDSLSFFDAEGMRFHLPAFLIADIEGKFIGDLVFHLATGEHQCQSRFTLLTQDQRFSVREFLTLWLSDLRCGSQRPMIEEALNKHWL
jgi:hypothetical protein